MASGANAIEQQINILDQYYQEVTTITTYSPTDNSLGLIRWDSTKYNGEAVYFEAEIAENPGCTGNSANAALFTSGGSQVTNSQVSVSAATSAYSRLRSVNILANLTNGTDYTVRIQKTNGSTSCGAEIKAARLIIVQSSSSGITDTETQIEVGNAQSSFTNTDYAALTDYKIYQYNHDRFNPAPEASFSASLKIADSGDTVYAELYNCGSPCNPASGQQVAETSHTGDTNWTLKIATNIDGDADWDITNDDEYIVRVKCVDNNGGGCSGSIANAKIILVQSDINGVTALETVQQYIHTLATNATITYTDQDFLNRYDPETFAGGSFAAYFETTLKTSAGTGYARLWNDSNQQAVGSGGSGEISTTNTSYTRARTASDLSSSAYFPQDTDRSIKKNLDTQLKNSATNTTSVSSSWLIVQVSSLSTSTVTAYAKLYECDDDQCDGTGDSELADSEVSTTSATWSRVRTVSSITLTSGKRYVVIIKTTAGNVNLINAKIILIQSDVNGITALETLQQHVNTLATDTDATYTDQDRPNFFTATNFPGNVSYYFEATIKTSAGTGYAQLENDGTGLAITGSEVTTTTTSSYTRVRSSALTDINLVSQHGANMDTQLKNSATSGNTTSVSNSWLIIQISGMQPGTAYADLYNTDDGEVVTNSQVSLDTTSWGLQRSSAALTLGASTGNLKDGKKYVVRTWSSSANAVAKIASAKLIFDQTDASGIAATETIQHYVNTLATDTDATYTDQDYLNAFTASHFPGTPYFYFEATIKTSAGTGYAQLKNDKNGAVIASSQVTTTSINYERQISVALTDNSLIKQNSADIDTQLKNSATSGNTTSVSNSWLIIQIPGMKPAIAYADLYNTDDSEVVTNSQVSVTGNSWTRPRSSPLTLGASAGNLKDGKKYVVRTWSSSANAVAKIASAKLIFDQTDASGIAATETIQQHVNTLATDTDATYTDQDYLNSFVATNFSATVSYFFEATIKTSAGTGYAQLKNDLSGAVVDSSEISTSSAFYVRVRTASALTDSDLVDQNGVNMDTQLKNSVASGNTTSVSSSWLVIQVSGMQPGTAYADFYNVDDTEAVTNSQVSVTGNSWTRPRSSPLTLGASAGNLKDGKNYAVRIWSSSANSAVSIANAKLILIQSDAGGIAALETVQQYVNTKKSLTQTGTTAYVRLAVAGGAAVSGSTVSTTSTSYGRQRTASSISPTTNTYDTEISLNNSTYTQQDFDNYYDSVNWAGGTFTYYFEATLRTPSANSEDISNSWLIIQVSNIFPTTTMYAALYQDGASCTNQVSGSEISTSSNSWTRVRTASTVTLTTGTDYMVCVKNSHSTVAGLMANAKIIHGQSGYISATEIIHQYVNTQTHSWYNANWTKRQPVTVTNNTSSGLTNYQIQLTVTYDSDMQADFDDLRFSTSTSSGILADYWLESKTDSTTATVWVEVDSIPASSSTTIYMYYGNGSAASGSNSDNTFEFFDNFDDSSLDTGKWQTYGGTWTETGGLLQQTNTGTAYKKAIMISAPSDDNYVVKAKVRVDSGTNTDERGGVGLKTGTSDGRGYNFVFHNFTTTTTAQFLNDGVGWGNSYSFSWSASTWYWFKMAKDSTTLYGKVWQDGTSEPGSWTGSQALSGRTGYPALNGGYYTGTLSFDDVYVRKYASTEPSSSFGSEISNSTETKFSNLFDPASFAAGTFAYYFETTLKVSTGTGYSRLWNVTGSSQIVEINTTETGYTRVISASLTMPTEASVLDTRLETSGASSSWLIIQVSSLQIPEQLLFLIPFVIFLPKLVEWLRRRRVVKVYHPSIVNSLRNCSP